MRGNARQPEECARLVARAPVFSRQSQALQQIIARCFECASILREATGRIQSPRDCIPWHGLAVRQKAMQPLVAFIEKALTQPEPAERAAHGQSVTQVSQGE